MDHRHEYGPCCEHHDSLSARLDLIELLLNPPVIEEMPVADAVIAGDAEVAEDAPLVEVNVMVEAGSAEEGSAEEGSAEEGSAEEGSSPEEGTDVDGAEVVIEDDTGLPEVHTSEHDDRSHDLPMRR